MKKFLLLFFILLAVGFSFQACDDTKTYAEMLEEEDDAIADFINKEGIKVISQTEFFDNDSVTDVEKNEIRLPTSKKTNLYNCPAVSICKS